MHLVEVVTPAEKAEFHNFPKRLYKRDEMEEIRKVPGVTI